MCHHGPMRLVDFLLTSRRHIDLVRVAGAVC
ncbi:MAG: putative leader peptide [Jatrophihabitantaceae bacterium]